MTLALRTYVRSGKNTGKHGASETAQRAAVQILPDGPQSTHTTQK